MTVAKITKALIATTSAAAVSFGLALSAQAADFLGSYDAKLSNRDHYNSSGERLNHAGSIIRQDRANYHRFGNADSSDDWDAYFHKISNRAKIERDFDASTSWKNRIVHGTPYVRVNVYGYGKTVSYVRVDILSD